MNANSEWNFTGESKTEKKFLIQSTSQSHFIQSNFLNYYFSKQDDCN